MMDLVADVRFGLRRLRRTPGFTLVALITLALGIGANAALFSVLHAVMLRALPFADPDSLHWVWSRHTSTDKYPFSLPEYCDYRDRNRTLDSLAAFANWSGNLGGPETTERLPGLRVSGNFFKMLGVRPALGRTLLESDDAPGQEKVAVLSHGLWQRRFGGDPDLLGRPVILNGESFTVVGVLDRSFLFPLRGIEVAIPLAPEQDPWRHNRGSTNFLRLIGRARAGVSGEQVTADLEGIGRSLQTEFPSSYERKKGVMVTPLKEELTGTFGRALWMLMAAVALLLLIACANLASLMLVRATTRRQEMAIRLALGARPKALIRGLVVESGLVALGGATLGIVLAHAAVPALVAMSPTAMPRSQEIHVSGAVLLFSIVVALLSGLGFGVAPAWRATRVDLNRNLGGTRSAGGAADRGRTRSLIVASQIAVMVVLLSGASLLLKSFQAATSVEPGFDQNVLTVRMSLPRTNYSETLKVSRFYQEIEARVKRLPGATEVAATNHVPLSGAIATADYKVEDRPPISEDLIPTALYRMVTPRYLEAMGIPLIAGRAFEESDRDGKAPVAMISQALANLNFPDRDPIGHHLLVRDNPEGFRSMEIVGVVGDVRHGSLESEPEPHLYVPYHQVNRSLLVWLAQTQFLVVRTSGDPMAIATAVRQEIHAVDATVASAGGRATGSYVDDGAASRRFSLALLALFSSIALALTAVGIYGLTSYAVAQRTREIGLRLALGGARRDIVGLVLREGVSRTAAGIAAGLVAAVVVARSLKSLLFGVAATEPSSYAAVVCLIVIVTLLSCLLPAWRAASLEPVRALRED